MQSNCKLNCPFRYQHNTQFLLPFFSIVFIFINCTLKSKLYYKTAGREKFSWLSIRSLTTSEIGKLIWYWHVQRTAEYRIPSKSRIGYSKAEVIEKQRDTVEIDKRRRRYERMYAKTEKDGDWIPVITGEPCKPISERTKRLCHKH